MTDKKTLEDQWNKRGVARPKHAARWEEAADGELTPSKGKPMKPDNAGKEEQKKRLQYK